MGVAVNSGTVNVTGSITVASSVSFPKASATQTAVFKSEIDVHVNTTATLYTVTAGKTFYLTAFKANIGAAKTMQFKDGNAGAMFLNLRNTDVSASIGKGTNQIQTTFPVPIPITTSVYTVSDGDVYLDYSMSGFEE